MKIFYIYYHQYDDIPIHVSDVIEEFVLQKDEIHLFTSIDPSNLSKCSWKNHIKITNIPNLKIKFLNRLFFNLTCAILLPYWCFKNKPDILYERTSISTLLSVMIGRLTNIPSVIEFNGIVTEELRLGDQANWRIKMTLFYESFISKHSSLIIAVSEKLKQWLIEAYCIPPNKIKVVSNGTNTNRFYPRDPQKARELYALPTENKFYIGYLGTLTPWCGLELLIECAPRVLRKIPNASFLIGGGQEPYLSGFKQLVRDKGLQNNFHFFGNIPWTKANLFINLFDIAVLPNYNYFLLGQSPLKLYSYLACGKPVIGPNIGEVEEILSSSELGNTFAANSSNDFADKLIKMLLDPDRRSKINDSAPQIIEEKHSWSYQVIELKKLINQNI